MSESQKKPREFIIYKSACGYGDFIRTDTAREVGEDEILVREVLPELDAAVERMYRALEATILGDYGPTWLRHQIVDALRAFDQAKGVAE